MYLQIQVTETQYLDVNTSVSEVIHTLESQLNVASSVSHSLFENNQSTYVDYITPRNLQDANICEEMCYNGATCLYGKCKCSDLYYDDNCYSYPKYLNWDDWKEIYMPADNWAYYIFEFGELELEVKLEGYQVSCYILSLNPYYPTLPSQSQTSSIIRFQPNSKNQFAKIQGSFDEDSELILGFHCDSKTEDCELSFKFNDLAEEDVRPYLVWIILGIVVTVFFIALTCIVLKCYFRYKDRNNALHPEIQLNVSIHKDDDLSEAFPAVEYEFLNMTDKETCAVCLDDFNPKSIVRKLSCNHIFHQKCIDTWIKHHSVCCLCKQNVLPEATESSPYPLMNTSYSSNSQLFTGLRRRSSTGNSSTVNRASRLRSGSEDVTVLSQIRREQNELFYDR